MSSRRHQAGLTLLAFALLSGPVAAHDGPPFPILTDRIAGNYRVSIWTDPDVTDDGSAGGQFWIILEGTSGAPVTAGTRVSIEVAPADRAGPATAEDGVPSQGEAGRQFAAVVLEREGRYRVHVTIDGPLGPAAVDAEVEGTYDARPPAIMLLVYVMPFLVIGVLWLKLLVRRRRAEHGRPS